MSLLEINNVNGVRIVNFATSTYLNCDEHDVAH
jgi:hypothetical protein